MRHVKRLQSRRSAKKRSVWTSNANPFRAFPAPAPAPKTVRSTGVANHKYDHEFFMIEVFDADNIFITLKTFDEAGDDIPRWKASLKDGKIKYRDAEESDHDNRYILDEEFIPASIRAEVERIAKAKSFM